jgi:hypothetical protein
VLLRPLTLYTWRPHEAGSASRASAASKRLVTLAGRNVTRKVTEVTSFVTRYGIHYGIYYGIYYGFLEHVQVSLADAVHGFPAGSHTISRPFPLFAAVEARSTWGYSARPSVKRKGHRSLLSTAVGAGVMPQGLNRT